MWLPLPVKSCAPPDPAASSANGIGFGTGTLIFTALPSRARALRRHALETQAQAIDARGPARAVDEPFARDEREVVADRHGRGSASGGEPDAEARRRILNKGHRGGVRAEDDEH